MKKWPAIAIEDLCCLLVLGISAAAVLYPIFVLGDVPVSPQAVHGSLSDEWKPDSKPSGLAQYRKDLRVYTAFAFLNDSVHAGDSIFWNPLERTGAPFFAQWNTRCLSPFTLPFYLLDLARAFQAAAFLKLAVAGFCAFYGARRFGFQAPFALMAAVTYQLGAAVIPWLHGPLSDLSPWLPLFLVYTAGRVSGETKPWPALATVGLLMLLSGAPRAVAGAIVFVLVYGFLCALLAPRDRQTRLPFLPMLGALAVATAAAAMQIVPYLEFVRLSLPMESAPANPNPWRAFIHVVGMRLGDAGGPGAGADLDGALFFVGVPAVLMAALWCALRQWSGRNQRARIDGLLITWVLLSVAATALPEAAHRVLFGIMLPENLLLLSAFSFGIVGAAAAATWLELGPEQTLSALKRLAAGLTLLLGCGAGLAYGTQDGASLPSLGWASVLSATLFLVLFLVTLLKPDSRLTGYGMAAVIAVGLFPVFQPLVPFVPHEEVDGPSRLLLSVQDAKGRVGGARLRDWPMAARGVAQMDGTRSRRLRRFDAFMSACQGDARFFSRAGIGTFVFGRQDMEGNYGDLRSELHLRHVSQDGYALFEPAEAYPRVWLAFEGRPVPTLDPLQLKADQPPLLETLITLSPSPNRPEGYAKIVEESNIRVAIRSESDAESVLVLADAYYPGWTASLDGALAEVFPVDGLFRGVLTPPGSHEIVFHYQPRSFLPGALVSAIGCAILLFGWGRLAYGAYRARVTNQA